MVPPLLSNSTGTVTKSSWRGGNGENIKEVDSFVYLGKTVTKYGDLLPEIGKRIALGWAALVKWITF